MTKQNVNLCAINRHLGETEGEDVINVLNKADKTHVNV